MFSKQLCDERLRSVSGGFQEQGEEDALYLGESARSHGCSLALALKTVGEERIACEPTQT